MDQLESEKQTILSYTLEQSHGYTRILVQLFGSTGHGKSSLINSFIYALNGGKFQMAAQVHLDEGQESFGGLTTVRKSHQLTDSITVVDNRGFGKMDDYETGEIFVQLANILQLDESVKFEDNTFENNVDRVTGAEMNCTDLIVPLYVYSAESRFEEQRGEEIRQFLETAKKMTGMVPIVVLTKKYSSGYKNVEDNLKSMGIECIIGVENYTPQDYVRTPGKDKQFLTILQKVLELVNFHTTNGNVYDPKEEHRKRLKMLLMMAKEREVAKLSKDEKKNVKEELKDKNPPEKNYCFVS
ncbi:uncharacterized protein LOC108701736 [Xenopus laevis]|uniref:Uncharacterized protein n=2 Tax=Xenopus laevis TaxID=8355 RepID=A0A974C170_XENLA|nr:uncharacterized protein LOC108701736 [Xenopus laevis]OCT64658.1 hypothetical protein XELAEV_18045757mg [Xenopus laevis]